MGARLMRIQSMVVLLTMVGLLIPTLTNAQPRNTTRVKSAFKEIIGKARQGTVEVYASGKQAALGAVVDSEGLILTKASQLSGDVSCKLPDGRRVSATIVGIHKPTDLAMLRVDASDLQAVPWSEKSSPIVGSLLASPGLGANPIAIGVVSVAPREIPKISGVLGILIEQDELGPRVDQVLPSSGAEKAGLKVNDVVLRVDGKKVKTREQLIATIQEYRAGERVRLSIARGDERLELNATLGKRALLEPGGRRSEFQNTLGGTLSERRDGFSSALQHDTVLRPVDCGGPLVDLDGEVIGINIARSGRVSSLALPASVVKPLIPRFKAGEFKTGD